jgi:hypothetical protein
VRASFLGLFGVSKKGPQRPHAHRLDLDGR